MTKKKMFRVCAVLMVCVMILSCISFAASMTGSALGVPVYCELSVGQTSAAATTDWDSYEEFCYVTLTVDYINNEDFVQDQVLTISDSNYGLTTACASVSYGTLINGWGRSSHTAASWSGNLEEYY